MSKVDQTEKELFFQAMELDGPESIETFLDEKCSDDPKLRQRLQDLLGHHQQSDRILDQTVVHLPSVQKNGFHEPASGDVIGHYKLIEKLGEGGMGLVFRAKSDHHPREVAVKVIKLGMDTKRVVARFQAESQSLAVMDHPSITRILDVGSTAEGRPYFVMELVDGKPIHQFCFEEKLDLKQRLDLFVQVCQGVQHAHQKGIIHRDLKPSNVLVQRNRKHSRSVDQDDTHTFDHEKSEVNKDTPILYGEYQPKIIDFGIAKAIDQRIHVDTFLTGHGEFLGTPAFMSPEQAAGDSSQIDTRSDVYALGALLYRIIAGCSPFQFQRMSMVQIQKHIEEKGPVLPSVRAKALEGTDEYFKGVAWRQVQGDLDWVIMKCLAKKPSDRYSSPKELVDDLYRYLNGDPVEAAAPSNWYLIKKFAAKNVALISTAAAIVVLIVVGWVISSVYAFQAQQLAKRAVDAERLARQNFDDAMAAKKEAEKERDKARKAEEVLQELIREKRRQTAFYRTLLDANPDISFLPASDEPADASVPAIELRPLVTHAVSSTEVMETGTIVASFGNEKVTMPWRRLVVPASELTTGIPNEMETVPLHNKYEVEIPFLEKLLEEQRKEFGADDPEIKETLRLLARNYLEIEQVASATEKLCECYEIAKDTEWLRKEGDGLDSQYAEAIIGSHKAKECRSVLERVKTKIESEDPKAVKLKNAIDQVLLKLESEPQSKKKPMKKKIGS